MGKFLYDPGGVVLTSDFGTLLGDLSQQKTKTNLSTCQGTTQFITKRSNFTHKLAAAARLTLCWKYTKLVGTLLIGIFIFRQILFVAACKTEWIT